ncbi:MAG: 16S rRNA (guanine(966)-N(2))-methyltransferase RsmD [Chloroflexi bacterium]|nr:16S rRNA (guanine(966)-N(2))-methyltransferase RsmD [Chloroflexota bacterium]
MRIIAGSARGRKLHGVRRSGTRPTMDRVRESLFAILTPWMEDAAFLDLFAGSGAVGLEALSRGAALAAFIDSNAGCCRSIRENLDLLERQDDAIVIARPWAAGLSQLAAKEMRFDMIFADPPYHDEKVLLQVADKVQEKAVLKPGGRLIFQHTVRLHLPEAFPPDLALTDTRKFGETILSFYRGAEGQRSPLVETSPGGKIAGEEPASAHRDLSGQL